MFSRQKTGGKSKHLASGGSKHLWLFFELPFAKLVYCITVTLLPSTLK